MLGKIYQEFRETDSALETYRKIKGAPEIKAKAFNNMGIVYLSLNEPEKALLEFKNSLRTFFSCDLLYYLLNFFPIKFLLLL